MLLKTVLINTLLILHYEVNALVYQEQACFSDMQRWNEATKDFERSAARCLLGNCTDADKKLMKDNLFAIKQHDSFGKLPSGLLYATFTSSGNYEECLASNQAYKTSYCYASATLTKNGSCSQSAAISYKQAICMPSSCNTQDILWLLNNKEPHRNDSSSFTFCSAECATNEVPKNVGFYIFIILMAVIIGLSITATVVDYIYSTLYKMNANDHTILYFRLLLAFSLYTNCSYIMDTKPQREGHINSLDCIRFLSMSWVVFGHAMTMFMISDTLQPLTTMGHNMLDMTVMNAFFSVDTFFLLSGLLVAYMFFRKWPSTTIIKSPATWILYVVHRYLRLTPPYALFIFFYAVFLPSLNGPWMITQGGTALEEEICQKYWWRNMLYINNYFTDTECYPITWYMAVDTQLYLAAPVFLVAVFFSWKIGFIILLIATIASCGGTFALTFIYDLPGVMSDFTNPNLMHFFNMEYVTPWIRCTPYIIGLAVGFLLARKKEIKLHRTLVLLGWIIATIVALLCVYGPYKYIGREAEWSKFTRSSYYAFSRIGWALSVSWVIIANHYKWGGPIAKFMGHPFWQPFGRLSYCAYIVHYFTLQYFMNLSDRPSHFVGIYTEYLYNTIPITVLAYIFAFVWSSLCELPFLNLEKILLGSILRTKKVEERKEVAKENWN